MRTRMMMTSSKNGFDEKTDERADIKSLLLDAAASRKGLDAEFAKLVKSLGYKDGVEGKEGLDVFRFIDTYPTVFGDTLRGDYRARIYCFLYGFAYMKGREEFLSKQCSMGNCHELYMIKLKKFYALAKRTYEIGVAAMRNDISKEEFFAEDVVNVIDESQEPIIQTISYDFLEYGFDVEKLVGGREVDSLFIPKRVFAVKSAYDSNLKPADIEDEKLRDAYIAYKTIADGLDSEEDEQMRRCLSCPELFGIRTKCREQELPWDCSDYCEEAIDYFNLAYGYEVNKLFNYYFESETQENEFDF